MKHGARLASSVCLAASVALCLATLLYTAARFSSPAHAMRGTVTESVSSSPSSGPVGATITVSGSGWPDPDGEQVSFGYMIASYCSIVPDSQAGSLHGGSFSGWFIWPNGTPLGIYPVCATFGSTTAMANTYTVLSASAPQVFISPTILTAGNLATITGSNYFPAGTAVQLFWETVNGSVELRINPAISNNNGAISRSFFVPTTTLSSGSYKIVASVGGGQPPTLTSSATFAYNAPAPNPTPTPSPVSDPTPTQQPSLKATATAIAGTTPIITPTTGSTTATSGATGNTTTTNQPDDTLLLVGVVGSLALLVTILAIVLLIRRKKAHSKKMKERDVSAGGPTANSVSPWQNGPVGPGGMPSSMPGWPTPSVYGGSMSPTPAGQAVYTNNGPSPSGGQSAQLPPQQMQYSPYVHLLQQPVEGSAGNVNDYAAIAPDDPTLEAIKRQVQMGLYAAPRQR